MTYFRKCISTSDAEGFFEVSSKSDVKLHVWKTRRTRFMVLKAIYTSLFGKKRKFTQSLLISRPPNKSVEMIFSYFSTITYVVGTKKNCLNTKTYVVDTQKNCLIETVLLSTKTHV